MVENFNSKDFILPEKPFKLGTTSFIFPDHIIPNVKKLGAFFDEIELLIFESQPKDVLPSKQEVKDLFNLSQQHDLTYNIHLPVDVSLTCDSLEKRQKARDTLLRVMDLFSPLSPTSYTLHLEMLREIKEEIKDHHRLKLWEKNARQGLAALLSGVSDPRVISIENLDYPFSMIQPLVEEFDLSVCLDVGHQIKYGYNLMETFEKQKLRTSILHLHGVAFSQESIKDHTSLDQLPEKYLRQIQMILKNFSGTVSLEVFNLENLNRSLFFLSKVFKDIGVQLEP